MKTISFYSYKGGVGRSLALANMAQRFSDLNKKICIIDFDLEAPGMPAKFAEELGKQTIQQGLVDYIHAYAVEGVVPESIAAFSISFALPHHQVPITLIPAGDSNAPAYWKKLSTINWYELLYEDTNSIRFFLNLKEQIRKEINPDFLLIDSRTGISEISGISLVIMADKVAVLAANNRENIDGVKKVLTSLRPENIALQGRSPEVHVVMSRVPFTDHPKDRAKEQKFLTRMELEFKGIYDKEILIIHSDRELEERETLKIEKAIESSSFSVASDYLRLFEKLTENDLDKNEIERFGRIKKAFRIYKQALLSANPVESIALLNQAIELDPEKSEYYSSRGEKYEVVKQVELAEADYLKAYHLSPADELIIEQLVVFFGNKGQPDLALSYANLLIELYPTFPYGYFHRANINESLGHTSTVVEDYRKAIELGPQLGEAYNNLANYLKRQGNIEEAKSLVFQALQLNPEDAMPYSTLAEISSRLNLVNEFYLYTELAFMRASPEDMVYCILAERDDYLKFFHEERFQGLLKKYLLPSHLDQLKL